MPTRGYQGATVAVAAGGWVTICDIQIGGAEGVHLYFTNDAAQNISQVRFLVSYDDGVGFIPYPYATPRDINVLIDKLIATTGEASLLAPCPEEGIMRIQMQVAATTTNITYKYAPVNGDRLGTGLTIDGIDYGKENDVGATFHGQIDVDNTGVQSIVVSPECEHFILQNCSLVPIHVKFGEDFSMTTDNAVILGPCMEDPANPGDPLLGTGASLIEETFKGDAYVYDPANTPADLRYALVGVQPV